MLSVAPFNVGLLINQMGANDRLLFCGAPAVITKLIWINYSVVV